MITPLAQTAQVATAPDAVVGRTRPRRSRHHGSRWRLRGRLPEDFKAGPLPIPLRPSQPSARRTSAGDRTNLKPTRHSAAASACPRLCGRAIAPQRSRSKRSSWPLGCCQTDAARACGTTQAPMSAGLSSGRRTSQRRAYYRARAACAVRARRVAEQDRAVLVAAGPGSRYSAVPCDGARRRVRDPLAGVEHDVAGAVPVAQVGHLPGRRAALLLGVLSRIGWIEPTTSVAITSARHRRAQHDEARGGRTQASGRLIADSARPASASRSATAHRPPGAARAAGEGTSRPPAGQRRSRRGRHQARDQLTPTRAARGPRPGRDRPAAAEHPQRVQQAVESDGNPRLVLNVVKAGGGEGVGEDATNTPASAASATPPGRERAMHQQHPPREGVRQHRGGPATTQPHRSGKSSAGLPAHEEEVGGEPAHFGSA